MSELTDRITRIKTARADAKAYEIPAWVNTGLPPNPRSPSETDDHVDFYSMWTERDQARTELADCQHRIEALTELVKVLHDETGCEAPCHHFELLDQLALG